MDLEKRLREAKPELDNDVSQLNALVLAALAKEPDRQPVVRHKPFSMAASCLRAFVQYPLPTLIAASVLVSLLLLQLGSTFGFSEWLMQQAGSMVFR